MHSLRIALAVFIICQAPVLVGLISGEVPGWMIAIAVVGLLLAAVIYFIPRRDDLGG